MTVSGLRVLQRIPLHEILASDVLASDIQYSKEVNAIKVVQKTTTGGRPVAQLSFADGSPDVEADLVIAADGIHSVSRWLGSEKTVADNKHVNNLIFVSRKSENNTSPTVSLPTAAPSPTEPCFQCRMSSTLPTYQMNLAPGRTRDCIPVKSRTEQIWLRGYCSRERAGRRQLEMGTHVGPDWHRSLEEAFRELGPAGPQSG